MSLFDKMRESESNPIATIATYVVVGIVSLTVLIAGFFYNVQKQSDYEQARSAYLESQLESKTLINNTGNERLVVDTIGQPSKSAKEITDYMESIFKTALTYDDSETYTKNRETLKAKIKDDSFFEEFLPADEDTTGHSIIEATGNKSVYDDLAIYEIGDKKYFLMASYIPYRNKSTLDNKSILKRQYVAFQMKGDPYNIQTLKLLPVFDEVTN